MFKQLAVIAVTLYASALFAEQPRTAALANAPEKVNWASGVALTYDGSSAISRMGQDTFGYDDAGRLVQAKVNDVTRSYDYDAFGNRKNCTQSAPGDCQVGSVSLANNHLDQAGYSPSGNVETLLGHTYSYDSMNMMTNDTFGGVAHEFVYTADNQRIAIYTTGTNSSWRWTVRDITDRPVREFTSDGTNTHWTWSHDYVWREGALLASLQKDPLNNTVSTFHYHTDQLGTPRRVTDNDERIVGVHDYLAFGPEAGTSTSESPVTTVKYTGQERDAWSGSDDALDYMHARYYSSYYGRFLSVDPNSDSRNSYTPQSLNLYAYALDSPISFMDPTGEVVVLVGTADRQARELQAFKDSLMDPTAAGMLTTAVASDGSTILHVDNMTAFRESSDTADTLGEAMERPELIYFYLGKTPFNSGGHAPAYTMEVDATLTPKAGARNSYISIDPSGLPLWTRGGIWENLNSSIQHELGHALAIAKGWRGTAPAGPMGGTNPFAVDSENKARRWYRDHTLLPSAKTIWRDRNYWDHEGF